MSRTICVAMLLASSFLTLECRAQSPQRAALLEKAQAASDALARCAYFLALDALPSRWQGAELKRVITQVCGSQLANHQHANDAVWYNSRPDEDKIDLNEKPKTDEEMYPSAMFVVHRIVEQYEKSLRALKR